MIPIKPTFASLARHRHLETLVREDHLIVVILGGTARRR
jgi:hypothetical protein